MFCPVCRKDWSDDICDGEGNETTLGFMAENTTGTTMSKEGPIETADTCAICHNVLNFDGPEELTQTLCDHIYHLECLMTWIERAVRFSFDWSN